MNRFFYNPCTRSLLRKKLFEALKINACGEEGLREFQERGYFFIDAVECRVKKTGGGAIPGKSLEAVNPYCQRKLKLLELEVPKR